MRTILCAILFAFPALVSAQTALPQLKGLAKDAGVSVESLAPAQNVKGVAVAAQSEPNAREYKSALYTPEVVKPALELALAAFQRAGVKVYSSLPLSYSFRVNYEATFQTVTRKVTLYTCPGWSYDRNGTLADMRYEEAKWKTQYPNAYGDLLRNTDSHGRLMYSYKIYRTYSEQVQASPEFGYRHLYDTKNAQEAEAIAAVVRDILRKKSTTAVEAYAKDGYSGFEVIVQVINDGGGYDNKFEGEKYKTAAERDEAYKARLAALEARGAGIYYKRAWDERYPHGYEEHGYSIYYIP